MARSLRRILWLLLGTASLAFVAALLIWIAVSRFANPREIGRTDPRRAANYMPLLRNFDETYTTGTVLGIAMGASLTESIKRAELEGFEVDPGCWGDNRAGQASLYQRSELQSIMLKQSKLCWTDHTQTRRGMIINYRDAKVVSINLYYINSEAI